jgi:hypothetical protein
MVVCILDAAVRVQSCVSIYLKLVWSSLVFPRAAFMLEDDVHESLVVPTYERYRRIRINYITA